MTDDGYIYVKGWDRRQQGRPENAQWHKSWNSVLRYDRYLDLTLAQRGLLHDVWALVSMSGEGRVSVARGSLERQLGVRRVSLEPLIQAGFISLGPRATQGRPIAREEEKREDTPISPQSGDKINPRANGTNPRASATKRKRKGAVQKCRFLYHQAIDEGDAPERARDWLLNEYRHDPSIVTEAIGAA